MEHPERDAPDLEEQLVEERVRRWMKEDVGKRAEEHNEGWPGRCHGD